MNETTQTTEIEFTALQNFANTLNLTVHKYQPDDARKKVLYFLNRGNTTISQKLDYNGLNHFMSGYFNAIEFTKQMMHSIGIKK